MSEFISNVLIDEMPEITDFSKGRKNPFTEKNKKEGKSHSPNHNEFSLRGLRGGI